MLSLTAKLALFQELEPQHSKLIPAFCGDLLSATGPNSIFGNAQVRDYQQLRTVYFDK